MVSKCRGVQLEDLGNDSYVLRGEVKGETVEISFWHTGAAWEMETQCTCELGRDCHHAAGLLAKAAKSRDLERLKGAGLGAAVRDAIEANQEEAAPTTPQGPRISPKPSFALEVSLLPVDPHSKLILKSLGQAGAETCIFADAYVIYDEHRLPLRASRPDWITEVQQDGESVILEHDKAAENAAARLLVDSGLSSLDSNSAWQFLINLRSKDSGAKRHRWFPDPERIQTDLFWHRFRGEWEQQLKDRGWEVTFDDQVGHEAHLADPQDWNTELRPRGGGWFDLSVGFEVSGNTHDLLPILAELLENEMAEDALEGAGQPYVYAPLPNGDALQLPVDRVKRILQHLSLLIDPEFPERTQIHALDAATLTEALELEPPADISGLAAGLRNFEQLQKVDTPANIQATLRDYQLAGFHWMHFLARHGLHGILADDMGLGKTLQSLTHIQHEQTAGHHGGKPSLVIAPTSVIPNWQAEAKKFTPGLKVLVLEGPQRRKHFDNRRLWNAKAVKDGIGWVVLRWVIAGALLTALFGLLSGSDLPGLALDVPTGLFSIFQIKEPTIWGLPFGYFLPIAILLGYPWLSVYPQNVIYRAFFFQRYKPILGGGWGFIVVNAAAFSLGHVMFNNWVVLLLTFVGGLIFTRTYLKSGSLLLATIEHAMYGIFCFYLGIGVFLLYGAS